MADTKDQSANAGVEQNLTDPEKAGTSDNSQSLNEQQAEDRSIEGLSRRIEKQNRIIATLTEQVKATEATKPDPSASNKELDDAKAELAKAQVLLKYRDVADKLEPILKKGLNPEFVDEDFVAVLRAGADEEETPAHNPPRGKLTPEMEATKLLKSLDSLFPTS